MKLVLFVFILVVAAGLGGCVTSHATYTPTGQRGFAISCSGAAHTWGDCLSAAGNDCTTQGFTVLSRNGTSVPIEYFNANDNKQIKAKLFTLKENDEFSRSRHTSDDGCGLRPAASGRIVLHPRRHDAVRAFDKKATKAIGSNISRRETGA